MARFKKKSRFRKKRRFSSKKFSRALRRVGRRTAVGFVNKAAEKKHITTNYGVTNPTSTVNVV